MQFLGTLAYPQSEETVGRLNPLAADLSIRLVSDAEFINRFTGSYGVLSGREPQLTEIEVVLLKKLADLFRVNSEYARSMLEGIITDDSKASATFNYLLANIYYESEEYVLAEREYQKAIDKFPDFQRAWTNFGVLRLRGDDYQGALEAFSRSVELGNITPGVYGKLGFCHFMTGNYLSAEAAYTLAIMGDPKNRQWKEGKVEVYMESGRHEEAAHMLNELINEDPTSALYWLSQSNAYLALGQSRDAARNIEVVRKMGKADSEALLQLGELYTSLSLNALAMDCFEAVLNRSPKPNQQPLVEAALAMNSDGDLENASKLLQLIQASYEGIDSDTKPLAYRLQAVVAKQQGENDRAIASWQKLLELTPLDGTVILNLVTLYAESGQRDRAYLVINRAIDDESTRFEALLAHAKLLVEDRRFSDALVPLSKALQIKPSDSLQNLYLRVKRASDQANSQSPQTKAHPVSRITSARARRRS